MSGITALLLAGSRPGVDPFAQSQGTDLKALIPLAGRPMVERPARALLAARSVAGLLVLAQQPERIRVAMPNDPRIRVEPSGGTIAETLLAFCNDPRTAWPLLVTTADHALLTPAMIDQFVLDSAAADIAIAVVERSALVTRFPKSKRTWLTFRGGAYTGANLFYLGSAEVAPAIELWRAVEQDRKKGWRLLSAMGPLTLLGAALRLLTIDQAVARVGRRMGLRVMAVRMADPLAAIDVDKPADLELVEAILAGQA